LVPKLAEIDLQIFWGGVEAAVAGVLESLVEPVRLISS
jgi:hypothetical protein